LICQNGLIQTISSLEELKGLEHNCSGQNVVRIHIKINTGLNRLGTRPTEFDAIKGFLLQCKHIKLEGIFTHFSTPEDTQLTNTQFELFNDTIKNFDTNGLLLHACSSNALWYKQAHLDMVRVGLSMYGYDMDGSLDLIPSMSFYGQIIKINAVEAGEYIGYSKGFEATKSMTVATVDGGYGDGILRGVYKKAYINGYIVNIVGHISMDMFCIDVSNLNINLHDKVFILGKWLSATDTAKQAGTIPYQLLTTMRPRTKTVYVD